MAGVVDDPCAVCLVDKASAQRPDLWRTSQCETCRLTVCYMCKMSLHQHCPVCDREDLNAGEVCVDCEVTKHVSEMFMCGECGEWTCYKCFEGFNHNSECCFSASDTSTSTNPTRTKALRGALTGPGKQSDLAAVFFFHNLIIKWTWSSRPRPNRSLRGG